ncbi:MAG: hypothetical protein EHM47_08150 [Ignavibacteriales bacterium]|nr:MAG: hypothetical protein EHM47_08150 [Ignavibacteriales bacterium]
MKQLFYTLLILGLIYFVYWYITKPPEIIKVSGDVRVLKVDSSENSFTASISGTAENIGDITVKDIWIIYKINNEDVTAYIGELKPEQQINFRTGTTQINTKTPEFELVKVQYTK